LRDADIHTFDEVLKNARSTRDNLLVYMTHPDYDHVRGVLEVLRPDKRRVVIYCATRPSADEAIELGRIIGELRPHHTTVSFEPKAVAALLSPPPAGSQKDTGADVRSGNRVRRLRERFGFTQSEMARSLDVSLRTIQNWERDAEAAHGYRLRDLEELSGVLSEVVADCDLSIWLRSENHAFAGKPPIDLLLEGKARDILAEFRRLQSGEPV
jgi:transcriptional regulator with XRE-family HTH domain